jgi:hypothetical protein
MLAVRATATLGAPPTPLATFTRHRGYIPQDADVLNGTMTIDEAQHRCSAHADCMGITLAAEWDAVWAVGTSRFKAQVWLKGTTEWVAHNGHLSFIKKMPKCTNVKFMRYKRAAHGPFCCEGRGCPSMHGYDERRCVFPAAAMQGLPSCANLRGLPLRNLAVDGVASASSEYPYAENGGPGAANDGVVNSTLYHSDCEGGPQFWRLQWAESMALTQIVIHNRKEFQSRLFDSEVRLMAKNSSVLATWTIRASRSMYVWTLRPLVRDVSRIELRTPRELGCLHFKELEAFGVPMSHLHDPETSFRELPEASSPSSAEGGARAGGGGHAAGPSVPPSQREQQSEQQRAHAPRTSHSQHGPSLPAAQSPTPRPGAGGRAAATKGPTGEPPSDEDFAWIVTTSSLTTFVLLFVQLMWAKARWLDCWR